ncbi:aldehyde dehydrogenase family protein [Nocardioides cavernae]|uniref:Aldehyde dehydrogenase family protein n=1 Tax=Nocardioides cavernae TaxID=1921566 RepID=A0ABR8NF37_9ACTN|nr:aldehyde dehydrogenase family protein [Nocardioides cavernae]MBD3926732.1 aldehyde dehydrogenase family protein [Nocardioides cavernae]MBM7512454.1 acyl-CoA reductase-like NAD-dependent aldehyde dehydrogenase [Nocardioides cavernae]
MRLARENPSRTDECVGVVEIADAAVVGAAVGRASAAQPAWARVPVPERSRLLHAAADRVASEQDAIAELMARETGKVLPDCRGEVAFAVTVLRWAADTAARLLVDREVDDDLGRLLLRHRPYGVVAAVTPWNAPVVLAVLKVGPALATGNTVVVKPSPLAPFAVARFLDLVADRLPDGALQVVQGDATTSAALVGHPGVDRVAFTGGEAAGRAIGELAGRSLTPSLLELGGNDPAILLADVVLDDAAMDRMVMAAFATSGQVCMAVKRLYVHRSRHAELIDGLRAAADRVLCWGDAMHPGVTMGPLVSAAAACRVGDLLERAVGGGAYAIRIGRQDDATDPGRGHYLAPHLVLGTGDDDALVAEEQFGPVLPVLSFRTEEEALTRANSGDLGLGASVWSADEDHAFDLARRLDAGFTFVNTHNRTGLALRAPFGGVKRSGWGREYGDEGLLEHVQTCVVHAPGPFRPGGTGLGATAYPTG